MSRPTTLQSRLQRISLGCFLAVLALPQLSNSAVAQATDQQPVPAPAKAAASSPTTEKFPKLLTTDHVPNAVLVHEKVISGGLPEGEPAFRELAEMNIKTIISVDGMKPDAELAAKFGMRYVHLPHGYDDIPAERVLQLAKAVRELEGPIYIHCHHGKHRSPAAAGAACKAAGLIDGERANEVLQVAGTGTNYRGLFAVVANQRSVPAAELEKLKVDYQAAVPIPPMAEAMVDIEHVFANLKKLSQNQWNALADHPELVVSHEAILLQEHFKELMRTPETLAQPAEFQQILKNSEQLATSILALVSESDDQPSPMSREQLNKWLDGISSDCKSCHQSFRDNP